MDLQSMFVLQAYSESFMLISVQFQVTFLLQTIAQSSGLNIKGFFA